MGSREVLVTKDLTKVYGGFIALDRLNLAVTEGSCVGYLGPNGSGKSTTIKILTGLSRATSGTASIFGNQIGVRSREALSNVGAVVETPVFQPFLTPVDVLSYFGKLRGMQDSEISKRTTEVLETVHLQEWASRKLGSFSKGMTQRVALASALLHDPDLFILDEPTSGLDPRGRVEVREIIKSLKKSGKTIFMSTHFLAETQEVCDAVAMLDRGKLVKFDSVQNILQSKESNKMRIELLDPLTEVQLLKIRQIEGVVGVEQDTSISTNELVVEVGGGMEGRADFLNYATQIGLKIIGYRPAENVLESYYLSLMPEATD